MGAPPDRPSRPVGSLESVTATTDRPRWSHKVRPFVEMLKELEEAHHHELHQARQGAALPLVSAPSGATTGAGSEKTIATAKEGEVSQSTGAAERTVSFKAPDGTASDQLDGMTDALEPDLFDSDKAPNGAEEEEGNELADELFKLNILGIEQMAKEEEGGEMTATDDSQGRRVTQKWTRQQALKKLLAENSPLDELALVRGWNTKPSGHQWKSGHIAPPGHWIQMMMHRVISHPSFDIASGVLIVMNCFLSGIAVHYSASHRTQELPVTLEMASKSFIVIFLIELLFRFFGQGCRNFFCTFHGWNYFDLLVVSADVCIEAVNLLTTADISGAVHLEMMRVLRVVRVARALRVLRLLQVFKALRLMVLSILRCGAVFLWSIVLLFGVVFLTAMYFTAAVTPHLIKSDLSSNADRFLDEHFSSVPGAVNVLFMSISGGVDWSEVAGPLAAVHWSNRPMMILYVFFTMFALMNIITGIFVEFAVTSAHNDKDEVIAEEVTITHHRTRELLRIFHMADTNEDGTISSMEFIKLMVRSDVRAILKSMGVEVSKAVGMFKLLDSEMKDALTPEEFVTGMIRLKGNAKTIDLVTLMHENKKCLRMVNKVYKLMENVGEVMRDLEDSARFGVCTAPAADAIKVEEPPATTVVRHEVMSL